MSNSNKLRQVSYVNDYVESICILTSMYISSIDETNALNLKLFPTYPNPQPVYDYQVPICTVDLNTLIDMNWDITVKKVRQRIKERHRILQLFAEYLLRAFFFRL